MFKRKRIILTYVLLFMVVGVACASEDNQSKEIEKNGSDKEEDIEAQQEESDGADKAKEMELKPEEGFEPDVAVPDIDSEEYKEARAKLEKLSEDEIKELIKKPAENDYQITDDFTEEDKLILDTLTREEYYDLTGITEDEVFNWIDVYHGKINSYINHAQQKGRIDSDEPKEEKSFVLGTKAEFEWIRDNYKFDKEYHNESMKEIVQLIEAFEKGDNDALFSLKYILYELNQEFNPEIFEEDRANHLSLYNAVRIQNGEEPLNEYE